MEQFVMYCVVGLISCMVGFVVGGLVMRNNYKRFVIKELEFKDLIMDSKLSAEQKILHIRNRIGV
jgi:hypothetical protein